MTMTMTAASIRLTLTFVSCCLLAGSLLASDRQITIKTPDAVYMATVDNSLLRRMNPELLPVFSPLVPTRPPLNPYLTAVSIWSGKVYDKIMAAPQLEDCQSGHPNCPPTMVNDAFLANARANLEKGRKQVRDLKNEPLPESLEPIRRFFPGNLETTLRMEEARYEYIKTGAVAPLRAMVDQYCRDGRQELIRKLEEAPDAETRRELAWHDWETWCGTATVRAAASITCGKPRDPR